MSEQYSAREYAEEFERFERSPLWELLNVKRALSSFSWENTNEQWARLAAVKELIRRKRIRAAKR